MLDSAKELEGASGTVDADPVAAGGFDQSAFENAARRTQKGVKHDTPTQDLLPRVNSPEEAANLSEGARFVGPDGHERVVPYKVAAPEDLNNIPDGADFVGPDGELRVKPKYQPIDVTAQYLYNVAHSPKGQRKALERSYPGKVRDDPSGGFFIEDDDGVFRKPGRGAAGAGGGVASAAAPVAASTLGAIGGGMAGGLPGIAGAAVGGAVGSKINDIVSSLAGVYDSEGATRDALVEGGLAAGGQAVGHFAGPLVKRAGEAIASGKQALPSIANKALGTDAEALPLARQMAEQGETEGEGWLGKLGLRKAGTETPPSQLFKEAPALHNIVEVKEPALHTQKPLRQSAEAHYEQSVGDILEGLGAKKTGSIHEPEAAVSVEPAGQRVLESLRAKSAASDQRLKELMDLRKADAMRRAELGTDANVARSAELKAAQEATQRDAQALVDQGFADIDRQSRDALRVAHAGHNTGDLWRSVGEQVNAFRTGIQERARTMYDTADELSGAAFNRDTGQWAGGAVIDTNRLSRQAGAFLRELPDGFEAQNPAIVRRVRDLAGEYDEAAGEWIREPAVTTWSQLRDLRTQLRQSINWQNLTPNVREGTYKYFNNRVNEILMDTSNPEIRDAVGALRSADTFYRNNIRILEDRQLQTLANGMKSGMQGDPKLLLDTIMKDGRSETARQMEQIVGPNTWNALRAADTQEMLTSSRTLLGDIDGRKFAREVLKRQNQGLLETLHGAGANRLVEQATRIEQLAGRLPIRAQPGDHMADVIMRARAAAEAAKEAAADPIKALQKEIGGIIKQHKAEMAAVKEANPFKWALDPTVGAHAAVNNILGHPDMLVAASRAFPGAEASPEFELIRQVYAQKFLQKSGLEPAHELAKVTPEIQALMFPGVTLKQMQLLAKEMELLMGGKNASGETGKSMMATSLVEHPIGAATGLGKLAGPAKMLPGANFAARSMLGSYYATIRQIATSPSTLRWLEKGLTSPDPAGREQARAALREFARKAGAAGAGGAAAAGSMGPGAPENE